METLGSKITEIRKQKGLTQEELSDLAKINLRTLQRIEKGETEPRGNTLKMLCNVLEINMNDIIDYGKNEDNKYLIFSHLTVLSFIIIPLGNIIIPSILWLTKRDKIIGLDQQGADLLNFQILWTILFSASCLLGVIAHMNHVIKEQPLDNIHPLFVIAGVLFLINIIYPIVVSLLINRKGLKRYYFPLIRFVRL